MAEKDLDFTPEQQYASEATCFVWRNISKLGFIPTGHFGHASIMLRSQAYDFYRYISWWPTSASKDKPFELQAGGSNSKYERDMIYETNRHAQDQLLKGNFRPRPNQVVVREDDETGEPLRYGTRPDQMVKICGLNGGPKDAANRKYGLHVGRMWHWFSQYEMDGGQYQLASTTKSCSGVALVSMAEGGGRAFATPPRNAIYSSPIQVAAYAEKLRNKIDVFNQQVQKFKAMVWQDPKKIAWPAMKTDYVTPVAKFKKLSAIKGKFRSRRLCKIDAALAKYGRFDWPQFNEKYCALISLLDNIMAHLREYPKSKRNPFVCSLGLEALNVDVLKHTTTNLRDSVVFSEVSSVSSV